MHTKKTLSLVALTIGSLALAPSAQAIPVVWTLNNVVFDNNATLSGQFIYNADVSGPAGFTEFNFTLANAPSSTGPISFTNLNAVVDGGSSQNNLFIGRSGTFSNLVNPNFNLNFGSALTNAGGGPVSLIANSLTFYNAAGFGTDPTATSGTVQGTPVPLESDALPIVGAAAFMAGGMWFKRRRAQAKANLDFLTTNQEKSA